MHASSTPGSDRSEATMTRLLDAAAALIAEVGWENTSSRKVAERAGVSLGVVHYHVESIGELRRRAAIRAIDNYFTDLNERVLSRATTPVDAIRTVFQLLAEGGTEPQTLRVLYQSLVAATFDEELRRIEAAVIQRYREALASYLHSHGIADPLVVSTTVVAAVDGYLIQRSLDPELDPEPVIAGLTRLLEPRA